MGVLYHHFYRDCESNTLKTLRTSFVLLLLSMLFLFGIPILKRTLQPWNLFNDLLLKCVQRPGKMWTMMNGSVCSTCQLWKLGSTPWNFAYYTNLGMVTLTSCLTLFLTIDATAHIVQGLTVKPFNSHLLMPQAISNLFCEAPWLWNELPIESSHLRLLPPLKEHVCSFTVNGVVVVVLGTWSVLACLLPMYPMSCTWII